MVLTKRWYGGGATWRMLMTGDWWRDVTLRQWDKNGMYAVETGIGMPCEQPGETKLSHALYRIYRGLPQRCLASWLVEGAYDLIAVMWRYSDFPDCGTFTDEIGFLRLSC
jgi:hypothetical protein